VPDNVAHDDNRPLRVREFLERPTHVPRYLGRVEESLGSHVVPGSRRLVPETGRFESRRINRRTRVFAVGLHIGEQDDSPITNGASPGTVNQYAEYPGFQRRAALKPIQSLEYRDPRLLDNLLGGRLVPDKSPGKPQEARVIGLDEVAKGSFVPCAETGQERG